MDFFVVLFRSFETNLLVFARILCIFAFNPILSRRNIPTIAKIGISLFITYIVILVVQPEPIDAGTAAGVYLMMILRETFIGLVIGFITDLFFYSVQIAGEIMDMQSGLGMAKVFDPETNVQMSIMGSFISFMLYLYFFATNSHMSYIKLFVVSYDIIPMGEGGFNPDLGYSVAVYFSVLLGTVIKLAMPIIAAELILEFCMGVLMKSVPQIQIMVINIQLKVAFGFAILFLVAVPLSEFIDGYLETWLETLEEFMVIMPAVS
ncbi:MAG: flagellar biosynthetic protein FliR [Ruminococcus sp.]|nr:flagellar biosynthetic protein FliR [Ruminococcus sp.]MCM1382623.1 flagellar biosynthetic protein FliR [Muribaculaceae bacterium]MCM1479006.1 flagellar biosynthetic protein FliR [Muribaculaceae bacterium]